ncbi:MAG: chalcone isomerase family protein [Flavobacterium sp.]|nr:chalcone isomerase family protein [Flavobacterium sp.]
MRKILFLILIVGQNCLSQSTVIVEDVELPVVLKLKIDDFKTKLVLNGSGVRTKFFISLYVEALYLKEKSTDATAILDSHDPMAVRLHLTSALVTNKKIIDAITNGIKKTCSVNCAAAQLKMDQMIAFFKNELKPNDYIDLIYNPDSDAIIVNLNNTTIGQVQGFDFKRALFGIWLEEKPINKALKNRLLGL